jgi:hypothetical protein
MSDDDEVCSCQLCVERGDRVMLVPELRTYLVSASVSVLVEAENEVEARVDMKARLDVLSDFLDDPLVGSAITDVLDITSDDDLWGV